MRALVLSLCLTGTLALAQAPDSPALTQALRELGEGDFDKALKTLDAAVKKTSDSTQLARLQLARGQCLVALGKLDKAGQAFSAALAKDPTIELDATRASPDAMDVFEKARSTLKGTVTIKLSGGAQGEVRVDGRAMGPAPLTIELPAGPHRVEARAKDGRSTGEDVKVVPLRIMEVVLALPPAGEKPPEPLATKDAPTTTVTTPPAKVEPPAVSAPAKPAGGRPWVALVPVAAGVLAAGGGALLWSSSNARVAALEAHDTNAVGSEPQAYAQAARVERVSGIALVGVGAAAVVGGLAWFLFGGGERDATTLAPSFVVSDGLVAAGVSGRLP